MASIQFFVLFVAVCGSFAAPATKNGKPLIDPECSFSPVISSDPLKCGKVIVSDTVEAVEEKEPLLFEGDIAGILEAGDTIADLDAKLNNPEKAAILSNKRWFGAYMYYQISSSFSASEQDLIKRAMKEFETKTDAVRFFPRGSSNDYINIVKGNGCHSMVGKQGGAQTLSLGNGCVYFGTIVHELNHAIGFWHEQSRSDRDSYVEINWNNIAQSNQHNFNKYAASSITTSGTGYDFGSIMHYEKNAFAISSNVWTIRPKSPWQNTQLGQNNGLSATDIQEINSIYKLCATTWYESNYSGGEMRYVSGLVANLHADAQDKISSAKVTLGCTLTIYSQVNSQGTATVFKPTQEGYVYYNFQGQTYDNDARSLKCTCP
ncbi:hatching enzyme 1.2-like [Paramacrobiotus metropolitanus]|uniref:hatching enzyme 1.2-like n=1 Tax=Paramacrobiotus metropolitanus TaxID=2943436 RepID=UPI0024465755|nr:hatching enzyme 1.2-like [Paramacrobiotus metropolitanus]